MNDSLIKDSLSQLQAKLGSIFPNYVTHPLFNQSLIAELNDRILSFSELIEEKPIVLIVGDSKSGKSTFTELLALFDPKTQSFNENFLDLLKPLLESKNSLHLSYHPGKEITISYDSDPKKSFVCKDFHEANKILIMEREGMLKISFCSHILKIFDIMEFPAPSSSQKKQELQKLFLNKMPYISLISFIADFLETKHQNYRKRFFVDSIQNHLRKISDNIKTIEKNSLTLTNSMHIEVIRGKMMENLKTNEKLNELFNNVGNIENLKKKDLELYFQLKNCFTENQSFDDMRTCLLKTVNQKLNDIMQILTNSCKIQLTKLLKTNIKFPKLEIQVTSELLPNSIQNSQNSSQSWFLSCRSFGFGLAGFLASCLIVGNYFTKKNNFYLYLGCGLICFLSVKMRNYFRRKTIFELNLEKLCKNLFNSHVNIQNFIKGKLEKYLEDNLQKCRENQSSVNQYNFEEMEKSLSDLKKKLFL